MCLYSKSSKTLISGDTVFAFGSYGRYDFRVVMLTAHALNPESLMRSFEMKARAYLPKEKLGEIVPFLEDIFEETDIASGWARSMKRLDDYFDKHWGKGWRMSDEKFFQNFDDTIGHIKL
jgi:hypothetical protein